MELLGGGGSGLGGFGVPGVLSLVYPAGSRTGVVSTRFFRDFVFLFQGKKRFRKGYVEVDCGQFRVFT